LVSAFNPPCPSFPSSSPTKSHGNWLHYLHLWLWNNKSCSVFSSS
jgi:hypothetical protein